MKRRNPPLTPSLASKRYFHGCSVEANAKKIMTEGLVPGSIVDGRKSGGFLRPVKGKVYLTPNIAYAAIYALGAGMVGDEIPEDDELLRRGGEFGYIFVVEGQNLADVDPDEDFIGEAVARGLVGRDASPADVAVAGIAARVVAPGRLSKVKQGYVAFQASVGKQIVGRISPWLKLKLIEEGAAIAHSGPVMPSEAWVLRKAEFSGIGHDASAFFQVAKRVELR